MDDGIYWSPAPPHTIGGMANLPASAGWIDGFLEYYDFGPPAKLDDSSGQACQFNFVPSTIDAVLATLDAQASLAGYRLDRSLGQARIQQRYDARAGAVKKGGDVVQRIQAGASWDEIGKLLRPLGMAELLDALQTIRAAGLLDQAAANLPTPRLQAAILSVQQHLGARWQGYYNSVNPADQAVIRHHIYLRLIGGDLGDHKPLKSLQGGVYVGQAEDDDAKWVKGFLEFHNLKLDPVGADPLKGGVITTVWLNGATRTLTDLLDTVVEQGTLAGRSLDRDAVRTIATTILFPAVPSPQASNTRTSVYLGYTIIPRTWHHDRVTGANSQDPRADQLSFQVTLEIHPDKKSGPELSWTSQVTAFDDEQDNNKYKVQSILTGVQAAWVFAFLDGTLQISPLIQALGGASRAQQTKDGVVRMVPTGQIGAGLQIMYTIPDTNEHLQIGGQGAASWTDPSGANDTFDANAQIVLQRKF